MWTRIIYMLDFRLFYPVDVPYEMLQMILEDVKLSQALIIVSAPFSYSRFPKFPKINRRFPASPVCRALPSTASGFSSIACQRIAVLRNRRSQTTTSADARFIGNLWNAASPTGLAGSRKTTEISIVSGSLPSSRCCLPT